MIHFTILIVIVFYFHHGTDIRSFYFTHIYKSILVIYIFQLAIYLYNSFVIILP